MKLPGVFKAKKKDGTAYFRASFTYRSKHISLGSFSDPETAHEAYLQAIALTREALLTIDSYTHTSPLSFEKWVCILNFRDNGIYFSTPIYVRPRFFYYYLSPHERLIFDIDDLFFYSSHKIMRRKNHFFVADYGMQITITSRYGIKSYGVEGRDYRFRNGNNHDFRYENIEIFNTYHGVSKVTHRGKPRYKAQIHLKGNYTIGYYKTEAEAAIAYNKAVDILKRNGCRKNFLQNETEGILPSVYAKIYSELKLSPRILNYRAE